MNPKTRKVTLLLGFVGLLMLLYGWLKTGKPFQNPQQIDPQMKTRLINYFTSNGLPLYLAELLVWQSAHETNFWRSKLRAENNNIFGMKYGGKYTQPYAKGEKNGYSDYETIMHSAADMIIWLNARKLNHFDSFLNAKNVEDRISYYAAWLKSNGFYEDSTINYTNGMLNAKNKLQ